MECINEGKALEEEKKNAIVEGAGERVHVEFLSSNSVKP